MKNAHPVMRTILEILNAVHATQTMSAKELVAPVGTATKAWPYVPHVMIMPRIQKSVDPVSFAMQVDQNVLPVTPFI